MTKRGTFFKTRIIKAMTEESKDKLNPAFDPPADAPVPQGRPTPTQAEVDAIVRGEKVILEPDGSPVQHHHGAVAVPEDNKRSEEVEVSRTLETDGWKRVPPEDDQKAAEENRKKKAAESKSEKQRGKKED